MATGSASGAFVAPDIQELKTKLYDICIQDPDAIYNQNDLFDFDVVKRPDLVLLLKVAQSLVDARLFKLLHRDGGTVWQARTVAEADKYKGLNAEQTIVYSFIDEAGSEGIWSKVLKTKSGLADTTLTQVLKTLTGKRLITDMKSVQFPTRKMYIKSSIRPSESATGGAWFTDGELDESFIEAICEALYNFIFAKSFYQSSAGKSRKPTKKPVGRKSAAELKTARKHDLEPQVKLEDDPTENETKQARLDTLLPLPPGYQGYPTIIELTRFVDNIKITDAALTQADIQQLIDVLVWDNKIEAVMAGPAGISYRALRRTAEEMEDGPSNGLTQAPCGKCPVFDLCEEGGPVAPSNCEYFKRWLDPDGY